MAATFGQKVIALHRQLRYTGKPLPSGIRIMNPFLESEQAMSILEKFCKLYLNDHRPRHIILSINPGRLGAGLTGLPFTDPKRLVSDCGIAYEGKMTHEPSSVFVYEMIHAYGGVAAFYRDFYINSPCPLGFTSVDAMGKETNYNYYDSKELIKAVQPFMLKSMHQLIGLGIQTDTCFCLGIGKNEKFLRALNEEHHFFRQMIPLEHPRFIMQYKSRQKEEYINKFVTALKSIASSNSN